MTDREVNWEDYNFDFSNETGQPQYPTQPPMTPPPPRPQPGSYSIDAMRQAHESQAQYYEPQPQYYEPQPQYYEPQPQYYAPQPQPRQPAWTPPPERPRKRRHGFHPFRWIRRIVTLILLLPVLFVIGSILLAKMPVSADAIGPRRDGCATVLLCGTDEDGTRTDTMMLLYIDRGAKQLRLLSLPRDTMVNRDNPVPKLNGAYGANGMGEKGMGFLMDYVKDLIGYRPDAYILLDLSCFEDLVDQMGGVEFDVPMDMKYQDAAQDLFINLEKGVQKLTGKEAMWLVRFRSGYAMADLKRVEVQRDFLRSAMGQWVKWTKILRAPGAIKLLLKNAQTDLDYRNLCWIALSILKCGISDLESDTLPGVPATVGGGAYYVEDRIAAAALINEKYNPYETQVRPEDLHPYGY